MLAGLFFTLVYRLRGFGIAVGCHACYDVLVGVDDHLSQAGSWHDEELLVLAPDDLHKAGTSGGDAYTIAVPNPTADGALLNERHELPLLDYLRLCCQFGGFPGYEGQTDVPPEIAVLRRDLLPF